MGEVSDKLRNQSLQNWAIIGLLAFLVAGLGIGGSALNVFDSGDENPDAPDVGEFVEIDYNEYTTDFKILSDALSDTDTVHVVSADAELPEDYNDHTVAASDLKSDFDSDVDVYSLDANADGEVVIDKSRIGANEDFQAGQEYRVFTDATTDYTSFASFTMTDQIEKFAYEEGNAQTANVELLESETPGELTEEVLTADGEVAGEDTTVDTGLSSRITTIENDGEFTFEATQEIDSGDVVLGDVAVSSVHSSVSEVSMTVRADGEVVYSDSATEDFTNNLGGDFVEEEMNSNPVLAENDVSVTVDVEYDASATSGSAADLVALDVSELDGTSFYAPTISVTA